MFIFCEIKMTYRIDTCESKVYFENLSYLDFDTAYNAFTRQMVDTTFLGIWWRNFFSGRQSGKILSSQRCLRHQIDFFAFRFLLLGYLERSNNNRLQLCKNSCTRYGLSKRYGNIESGTIRWAQFAECKLLVEYTGNHRQYHDCCRPNKWIYIKR